MIDKDGQKIGIMSAYDAQKIADEQGLDLVKIAPTSQPPVCKLMDYSKYKYEQNKKEKEMKRNQKTMEIKEVWLSMTIDVGDPISRANFLKTETRSRRLYACAVDSRHTQIRVWK